MGEGYLDVIKVSKTKLLRAQAIPEGYAHSYFTFGALFTGEQMGQYFQYPEQSLSHSISGTSVVEFYVDTNGSLNDINIVNSLGPQFDKVIIDGLSKFSLEKLKELKVEYGFRYRLPLKFEN